jgi:hypothetical protein
VFAPLPPTTSSKLFMPVAVKPSSAGMAFTVALANGKDATLSSEIGRAGVVSPAGFELEHAAMPNKALAAMTDGATRTTLTRIQHSIFG